MDLVKSVVIKGELSASEDLTLDGHMEGGPVPHHVSDLMRSGPTNS